MNNYASACIEQIKRLGFKPGTQLNIFCLSCSGSIKVFSDKPFKAEIQKFLDNHRGHDCFFGFNDGRKWKIQDDGEIESNEPQIIEPIIETITSKEPLSKSNEIENPTQLERAANPQAEDGHVDIANEIAEALEKINLCAYESRILWTIFRKTYGWHKKLDRISFTQFQKDTGLDRRNIQRTLDRLEKRKIIVVSKDYSKIVSYGFQKDYTKWKNIVSKDYDGGKKEAKKTEGVLSKETILSKETTDRSLNRLTQKKLTKENIYVEGSNELLLTTLLLEEIRKNKPDFKQPNLQVWARVFNLMLRRDNRSADRIEKVIRWVQSDYGDGTGRWKGWAANIFSPGSLREKFDQLEMQMKSSQKTRQLERSRVEYEDFTGRGQR